MKEVCRDFTVCISVPDDVELEKCEITIEAEASYVDSSGNSAKIQKDDIDIIVEDCYTQ